MNRSSITPRPALMVANSELIDKKKTRSTKDTSVCRFFQQKSNIQTIIPSNMNDGRIQNYTLSKFRRERIIYSEDVSRKKKTKIDIFTKSNTKSVLLMDDIENNDDFLQNLKKKFDKEYIKQSSENLFRKKSISKPKTLFTEESLKLMHNFKQYIIEKDHTNCGDETTESQLLNNNISIPLKNTSSSQANQVNMCHDKKPQHTKLSNDCNSYFQIEGSQKELIDEKNIEIPVESKCYSTQLSNSQELNLQLFKMYPDDARTRSISQISVPDSSSFVIKTVIDSTNDNINSKIRYPTPPLI